MQAHFGEDKEAARWRGSSSVENRQCIRCQLPRMERLDGMRHQHAQDVDAIRTEDLLTQVSIRGLREYSEK
jgi:hypothetical protein